MTESASPAPPSPSMRDRLLCVLATGLGAGCLPKAPGTWGSLLGPPLVWALSADGGHPWRAVAYGAFFFLIGAPICEAAIRVYRLKDPQQTVFDEIAAFFWVFLFTPFTLTTLPGVLTALGGFALFRLFDISKPWPVKRLERLPGGWGVMADDTAAGLMAGAILGIIVRVIG